MYVENVEKDGVNMIQTWMGDVTSLLEDDQYFKYYHMVPVFRREKADKLRFQKDKALSVGAWVLFEKMRERYHLKPEVSFNLSHSGTYALCSVDDEEDSGVKVGCDLEEIKEDRMNVAKYFFCESEYQNILENRKSFYQYWVLKESFMKATRLGMKLGMKEFAIGISEDGRPVLERKPDNIEGQYFFKEYECGALPYRVAVCSNKDVFSDTLYIVEL